MSKYQATFTDNLPNFLRKTTWIIAMYLCAICSVGCTGAQDEPLVATQAQDSKFETDSHTAQGQLSPATHRTTTELEKSTRDRHELGSNTNDDLNASNSNANPKNEQQTKVEVKPGSLPIATSGSTAHTGRDTRSADNLVANSEGETNSKSQPANIVTSAGEPQSSSAVTSGQVPMAAADGKPASADAAKLVPAKQPGPAGQAYTKMMEIHATIVKLRANEADREAWKQNNQDQVVRDKIKALMKPIIGGTSGSPARDVLKMGLYLQEMVFQISTPPSDDPDDDPYLIALDRFEDLRKRARMKLDAGPEVPIVIQQWNHWLIGPAKQRSVKKNK